MRNFRQRLTWTQWAVLGVATMLAQSTVLGADDLELRSRVAALVTQLDADDAAQRMDAEKQLIDLGLQAAAGAGGDAFFALLPTPNDQMPQELQTRLVRIRGEVQKRLAKQAVAETRVTLHLADAPLADVLKELEKQTGNRVIDYREQFGQEATEKKVTVDVEDKPFWQALDAVLDAANLSPYPYSGEEELALIAREPGSLRRLDRAAYAGPFRIEATNVSSQRGLRAPDQSGLNVDLEISWEPRLQPLAVSQLAKDIVVTCDDDRQTPIIGGDPAFDVESPPGSHAVEAALSLQLPAREATLLKSVKGKMLALVAGKVVELKFDDLASARNVKQESGGVTVTLERVEKNQELWEVHMRVRVGRAEDEADANRGWVMQNLTYLRHKQSGDKVDHAGYETTSQDDREASLAYFFEIPDDIANYEWVYRTPAAIVNLPVEYELTDVPLP